MYGKVFESMYDGTLASRGPWQALVTFQQLIVLANKDGIVDMTPDAIARRTSIPLEIIELGIAELMKPDARSRTPDEDGRRILLIEDHRDWGWQIVNHAKYQAIRKAEERREYLRNAQAERRNRLKEEARLRESVDASTGVNKVNTVSAKVNMSTPVSVDVSVYEEEIPPKAPKGAKTSAIGLKAWADAVKAKGEKAIPEGDPVFDYADEIGLPHEFLALAWREFRHHYTQPEAKRYRDWRSVFRKAVRGNWFKLWWLDGESYSLTTRGMQAQRSEKAA